MATHWAFDRLVRALRARPAHPKVLKDLVVDGVNDELGRVDRPPLRHDAHDVERLEARIERVARLRAARGAGA